MISHPSFAKRMREYAEEGIRHFYFMMLQKDEVRLSLRACFFFVALPCEISYSSFRLCNLIIFLSLSTSMPPNEEVLVDSPTIRAIQIAMSPNGPLETTCGWASSQTGRSRKTKSLRSTITLTDMGSSSLICEYAPNF